MTRTHSAALSLLLLGLACRSAATPEKPATAAPAPRPELTVVTRAGARHPVRVELATNERERAKGLMYRRQLADGEGMLFIFERDQVNAFWMKNTLIPLDMLFLAADGTVVGIVRDATPQTETPRTVGKPSRYVLEVNGGWTALRGVEAGDRVELGEVVATGR